MAKKAKPDLWMPIYFGDYLADTLHLTTEQHGAYLLLLMAEWKAGGYLPDDDLQLAAIAKLPRQSWARTRPVIQAFFTAEGGRWSQKRLLEEYERAEHVSGVRRAIGRLGGQAKRKQNESKQGSKTEAIAIANGVANGVANAKQTTKQNGTPSQSHVNPTTAGRPKSKAIPEAFSTAWQLYPKRAGDNPKERALKAWHARISEGNSEEDLLAGVRRYAAFVRATGKEGTEYVKQAATFFGPSKGFLETWAPPEAHIAAGDTTARANW